MTCLPLIKYFFCAHRLGFPGKETAKLNHKLSLTQEVWQVKGGY